MVTHSQYNNKFLVLKTKRLLSIPLIISKLNELLEEKSLLIPKALSLMEVLVTEGKQPQGDTISVPLNKCYKYHLVSETRNQEKSYYSYDKLILILTGSKVCFSIIGTGGICL